MIVKYDPEEMQAAEAEREERRLIAPGTYNATILEAGIAQTASGKDYISVKFALDDIQRAFYDSVFFESESPAGRAIALHKMHDYARISGQPLNGDLDLDSLAGLEVKVEISQRTSKGDGITRNNLKSIEAVSKPAPPAPAKAAPDPGPDGFAEDVPF